MRNICAVGALGLLVLLTACEPVISLQPLYTEEALVFEPGLLGCWAETGEEGEEENETESVGACLLLFEKNENSYNLLLLEAEGKTEFRARLVQLKNTLYLDLVPVWQKASSDAAQENIHQMHYLAGHTFYRIWLEKDSLRYAYIKSDWVEEHLASGDITFPHAKSDDGDRVVLTGTTRQLQRFVETLIDVEEAFEFSEPLYRKP